MNASLSAYQLLSIIPILAVILLAFGKLFSRRHCRSEVEGHGSAVLITGCDSGFGYELARCLNHKGFVVFAGCLFPLGMGAQNLARQSSGNLKILKLDVTSDEDVQQAKKIVEENLPEKGENRKHDYFWKWSFIVCGAVLRVHPSSSSFCLSAGLWAVVNNAGISDWAEIEWSTIEDFRHMVDINLFGCIRTTVAFLPLVRAAKGRVVFVSSIFSFFNCLNMGSYSVSKRGLEAFADCLRVEMDSFGVKVSIIQPGNFGQATNIVKMKTVSDIWRKFDDERKQIFNQHYIKLAIEYFVSTCKMGFTNADKVINAMLHALTAPRPKRRYMVVSATDRVFFQLYPFLPTALTDSIFSLSSIYAKRKEMLYVK
ncbi:D-beta-hydroxybutyrate dehydrogenase, mitochondrial-like isoform X1 [Vanacampus margaritifer]